MSYYPYVYGAQTQKLTSKEIQEIGARLEVEYNGGSIELDIHNINLIANKYSTSDTIVPFHHSIVAPIINRENTSYVNPPARMGVNKNDKPVSNRVQMQIDKVYKDMQFDLFMQKFERYAALQGTVFAKPAYDEVNKIMRVTEIYPSNDTLELKGEPLFPGVPKELTYSFTTLDEEDKEVKFTVLWTPTELKVTKTIDGTETELSPVPHKFGRLPWAMLKYQVDNTQILGYPDTELDSFCKMRSRVLHNAVARLYLSDFEKLLVTGVNADEALSSIRKKIIAFPAKKIEGSDQVIQPTAEFISPDGQDALNLLEAYSKLWKQLQDTRGHVSKPFSRGSDHASAEAIRLGSVELYNMQQCKRKFLETFEQLFWNLVKYFNNLFESVKIPEDTQLLINSAADEVKYFQAAMSSDVETPVTWNMHRNQEFTEEESSIDIENKRKYNEENRDQPVVEPEEEPTNPLGTEQNNDKEEEDADVR